VPHPFVSTQSGRLLSEENPVLAECSTTERRARPVFGRAKLAVFPVISRETPATTLAGREEDDMSHKNRDSSAAISGRNCDCAEGWYIAARISDKYFSTVGDVKHGVLSIPSYRSPRRDIQLDFLLDTYFLVACQGKFLQVGDDDQNCRITCYVF